MYTCNIYYINHTPIGKKKKPHSLHPAEGSDLGDLRALISRVTLTCLVKVLGQVVLVKRRNSPVLKRGRRADRSASSLGSTRPESYSTLQLTAIMDQAFELFAQESPGQFPVIQGAPPSPLFQIVSEFSDKRVIHGWVVLGRVEPRLVELRQWWGGGERLYSQPCLVLPTVPSDQGGPSTDCPVPISRVFSDKSTPLGLCLWPHHKPSRSTLLGHMRLRLQWQVVSPEPRGPPSSWGIEEEDVLGKGVGSQWEGQCSLCGGRSTRVGRIKPGDLGAGSQRGNLVTVKAYG